MFDKIFDKLRRKKNTVQTVQREIVIDKTETNKYFDTECSLYRYSKLNHYVDKNDEFFGFIEGFHTIPVHEEVEFEEAASMSISLNANYKNHEKKFLRQQLLDNPQKGTTGSIFTYMFEDGSLLKAFISYRDIRR